ncbi:MAG: hypothetical protein KJZ96_16705 [Rhodocyclaceae bacterium]|nr:hypothetical protein [Rhodocyclaceae bacterium]MCL4759978.1 hypothetical protein [Rhodocyclaceae bacterium]
MKPSHFVQTAQTTRTQSGQSMTEYLVAMLVVMMIVGVSFTGEASVIEVFLEAVRIAFDKLSGFLSLPL